MVEKAHYFPHKGQAIYLITRGGGQVKIVGEGGQGQIDMGCLRKMFEV